MYRFRIPLKISDFSAAVSRESTSRVLHEIPESITPNLRSLTADALVVRRPMQEDTGISSLTFVTIVASLQVIL